MPYAEQLGLYGSALPVHREAQQLFAGLVQTNPELAQQAFDTYVAGTVPADMPTATAYRIIDHFFITRADEFTIFSDAVDQATEAIKREWWIVNHASRTTIVDDEIARTTWRRARVGSYITLSAAQAVQSATPRRSTSNRNGRNRGRAVA